VSDAELRPFESIDEERLLRSLVEDTVSTTGEAFLRVLVRRLAELLGVHGAWVTEWKPEQRHLEALAFWMDDDYVEDFGYCVDGTPCADVIGSGDLFHIPSGIQEKYPDDPDLAPAAAVSFLGVPIFEIDGSTMGHLAVLDDRPMELDARMESLFRLFSHRAAAEIRRLRAEQRVRDREEKLAGIVDGAMDAILELDAGLHVTLANDAAARVFGCTSGDLQGRDLPTLLVPDGDLRMRRQAEALAAGGPTSGWIAGGLEARRKDGGTFPAEATLSHFEVHGDSRYVVVLRDIREKEEAERRLRDLTTEADWLRDELSQLQGASGIRGESPALRKAMEDIAEVARTDATVLLLGETGTGKELLARAVHEGSPRRERRLVRVNCASIPENLVESELFGHEEGAFTGATRSRDGRFTLADGGTLFLDEVGELPLEVQAKLLRVLQEGEIEPVGSDGPRSVDVRIVAATHRDLEAAVAEAAFREDLWYRLNVFPVHVPPLRERGDDIVLLARAFADEVAADLGRDLQPLSEADRRRLLGYEWPGNVRELRNVMERAVITAKEGILDLGRYLGAALPASVASSPAVECDPGPVLTDAEMEALERENLRKALVQTKGRISGPDGASTLLGMKESTLRSRLKALNVPRPD
jgi:PAS domain S-box-containing protein